MSKFRGLAGLAPALMVLHAFLPMRGRAQEIALWPNGAPGAKGTAAADKPTITPYPATVKPNGAAVVIFPGGGYSGLAMDHEGMQPALWLNTKGVSAFVVRYRLGSAGYRHPIEMGDGQRAIRWVRANAAKYGIDPKRVGVLGFSAGGHMASTVSTHYDDGDPKAADSIDRQGCRPDFSILGYPVITMDASFTHMGSRTNLLGTNPSQALVDSLSNEKQVTSRTPPAFLFHSTDDNVVPIRNSYAYRDSCRKRGVAVEMKVYDHGGHGYGMADGKGGAPTDSVLNTWPGLAAKWMEAHGFFAKATALATRAPIHADRRGEGVRVITGPDGRAADALGRRPRPDRLSGDSRP
jgi:acetyl esterase/lipase